MLLLSVYSKIKAVTPFVQSPHPPIIFHDNWELNLGMRLVVFKSEFHALNSVYN